MSALAWIVGTGLAMGAIALAGGTLVLFGEHTVRKLLTPLVALAAGTLLGGAFFHMIPAALETVPAGTNVWLLVILGFSSFLALEQFLHWHHCHGATAYRQEPVTYLILIGDALHNFIGGLAVAGTFLVDIRLGLTSWLAAAAHEIPQELGDFGVLVNGGWSKRRALAFNVLSALTFLLGGLVTYFASPTFDAAYLIPFAAGNFLYIGAADLVPQLKEHIRPGASAAHFAMFAAGLALMYAVSLLE